MKEIIIPIEVSLTGFGLNSVSAARLNELLQSSEWKDEFLEKLQDEIASLAEEADIEVESCVGEILDVDLI